MLLKPHLKKRNGIWVVASYVRESYHPLSKREAQFRQKAFSWAAHQNQAILYNALPTEKGPS